VTGGRPGDAPRRDCGGRVNLFTQTGVEVAAAARD
jgi:hypothetical protein